MCAIFKSESAEEGGGADEEEEVAGSSERSLDVTCSVRERNSSSYRSKGTEDDMILIYCVMFCSKVDMLISAVFCLRWWAAFIR